MRARSALFAALALAASLGAHAPAAAQREVAAGARVRVTAPIAPGQSRFIGTLARADSFAVVLRLDAEGQRALGRDTVVIPRSLIRGVDVSLGRTLSARRRTATTGAFAGAAAGMIVGLIAGTGEDVDGGPRNPWETAAWTVPAGALAGAGVGYALGGGRDEVWQPLSFSDVAVGVRFGRGMEVALRVGR